MNTNFIKIFRALLVCIIHIPLIKSEISGLDTEIVVGLNIQNFNSCPSGYIPTSGCDGNCDLNYNVGGKYIYLCQKKKKFRDLSLDDNPISIIKISYNNKNCGNLNLIDYDLNKGAGGEYIYLCYGTNDNDPSPITDIYIYIKGYNNIPEGYTCEWDDLNKNSKKKQEIYICYKKETKLPKYIEYKNLTYSIYNKSVTEIEAPNEVIYIDNDNYAGDNPQTITRTISKTIRESYSVNFNKSLSFLARSNGSYTFNAIPITTSFLINVEFDQNESFENKHIKEETTTDTYNCFSDKRRHVMCKIFNLNYKISLPYKINFVYNYYDGSQEIEEYQSELVGLFGDSIQFFSCCVKGCKYGDINCTQEEINNYDFGSGSCPENYTGNNNSNISENMIVTDIKLISSKYKYMKCPPDYEVINSGCDKEGCNLNYFSDGKYIYLCQKKKVIESLSEGEKPINSLDILYNEKECKNSLKLIDMDLKEGSEEEKIYLCYGNEEDEKEKLQKYFLHFSEEEFQNPIVDFFIFISELNKIPQDYECINKNLNTATTKEKTIFLCYTRNYNSFVLKSENEHNLTDNTAVLDLAIVHSSRKIITCPNDYEIVNKGCDKDGCDLNHKAGGEYIYLCQKKLLLEKLKIRQNPINKFKIIYDKNDNENLKLIDINLNSGTSGKKMYLAYGNDPNEKLSPIVDFFIHIEGLNTIPEGYECDNNDLNKGASGSYIYLCCKRNDNLPKEMIINNIELSYNNSERISLGQPQSFKEIYAYPGNSYTERRVTKITESKTMTKSFNFYSSFNVHFSYLSLIELGFNLDFNISSGEDWNYKTEKEISTEITCSAPVGKVMKCIPFITSFQINIPYKATMTLINYKGNVIGRDTFDGYFEKVCASQISYKTCCWENCCTGNILKDLGKNCGDNEKDILCEDIQDCFDNKIIS